MHSESLQIYWHDSHPIYSLCFQPLSDSCSNNRRLITSGGDNKIRVWQLNINEGKVESIDFLSSLTQHEQAVNVCRFNKQGDILATAGDDGLLLLWKKNDTIVKEFGVDEDEFQDFKESWAVWKRLRSGSASNAEIYDISWNAEGTCIATASLDNSVRIYGVNEGKVLAHISEHNHYVQGIVWDPRGEFIISQSADRSVAICKMIYENEQIVELKLVNKMLKSELPRRKEPNHKPLDFENSKVGFLFHNETLPSFFRRLNMSPCGNLLCVPAGVFRNDDLNEASNNPEFANAVYVYTRGSLTSGSNKPIFSLPFLQKPALVIKFNPMFYKLEEDKEGWVNLPFKLVFAVATSNEVLIYDSQNEKPITIVGNLHYTPITDLAWSEDGNLLMISSTDGFCSYINFEDLLGTLSDTQSHEYLSLVAQSHASSSNLIPPSETVLPSRIQQQQEKQEKTPKASATSKNNKENIRTPVKRPISELLILPTVEDKPKRRVQPILIADDDSVQENPV